jgi:hypothetical protein
MTVHTAAPTVIREQEQTVNKTNGNKDASRLRKINTSLKISLSEFSMFYLRRQA